MTKQELIAKRLSEPILVGDEVSIKEDYIEIETTKKKVGRKFVEEKEEIPRTFSMDFCKVIDKEEDWFIVEKDTSTRVPNNLKNFIRLGYGDKYKAHKSIVTHSTYYLGPNPFIEKPWNSRIEFRNIDIDSLLYHLGYDRRRRVYVTETYGEAEVNRVNWNPIVGDNIPYQRGLVWGLEEKQLLIESIYNNIEIGKVVFRYRSYEYILKELNKGNKQVAEWDVLDGKQRLHTILEFIKNEFPDKSGNYYNDLSSYAQHKFNSFRAITFGQLGENATDEDVLAVFLGINFTGIPVSQEHIDYVKSIKL